MFLCSNFQSSCHCCTLGPSGSKGQGEEYPMIDMISESRQQLSTTVVTRSFTGYYKYTVQNVPVNSARGKSKENKQRFFFTINFRLTVIPAEFIMFKMKLPTRTAEGGGDETAEDEQERTDSNFHIPCSVTLTDSNKIDDSRGGLRCPFQLDKDTVFEWFGLHLNPAKRTEFMCGLLHMCQPLELRFLGSCLEDIARKDFHVLRDFEIRANSPNDLGILTDITDPVVRSKLLVCLSLLRSENSECAGILFRILSHHVDPALYFKNYGFPVSSCRDLQNLQSHPSYENGDEFGKSAKRFGPPSDFGAGPLEQLALLFTMASLHPAFHFHQRETVRVLLDKVAVALEEEGHHYRHSYSTLVPNMDYLSPSNETSLNDKAQSHHSNQSPPRKAQWEAVYIEKIVLKGISRSKTDREYNFEVKWSDSLSSSITKKHHELEDFLLKLPKEFSTQSFEKGILQLLNQGDKYGSREQERTLRIHIPH